MRTLVFVGERAKTAFATEDNSVKHLTSEPVWLWIDLILQHAVRTVLAWLVLMPRLDTACANKFLTLGTLLHVNSDYEHADSADKRHVNLTKG